MLITGDSIPEDLGPIVARTLNGPQFTVATESRPITGIVRSDYFDWPAQAKRVAAGHWTTVIMLIGGNDNQPITLPGGGLAQPATPQWEAEYARRVGQILDAWHGGGVKQVYWLTMPATTHAGMNVTVASMRRAVHTAAAGRSDVTVYDADTLLGANAGLPAAHGPDGIHLSILGSRMIANALIGRLRRGAGH